MKNEKAHSKDKSYHRVLGRELGIYALDDEIGRGLPLWLPNGAIIRGELESYLSELEFKAGFHRVVSPHIARESLYFKSGHLPYFADHMYPPMKVDDGEVYRLRPMNCPHHHLIYLSEPRSYRDLPLRLAEFGQVYRLESSGALSGLMRVRGLCQNDAHIYCREDQVVEELRSVLKMHGEVYQKLGFNDYRFRLSLWDPKRAGEKFVDDPASWLQAEALLRRALKESDLPYAEELGEAAFYGPKIDVQMKARSGKEESFSSVQLDFASAARLNLEYLGRDGQRHRPFIIHRAPLGSHERIVAFLIELYGGWFPSWLAPIQARIIPIGPDQVGAAKDLVEKLRSHLIRADWIEPDGSLKARIRSAVQSKAAHVGVLGAREMLNKSIMLRDRGAGINQEFAQSEWIENLIGLLKNRILDAKPVP